MKKIKIPLILFLLFTILTNPNKENLESKLKIEITSIGENASEIEISRNNYLFFSTYQCVVLKFDQDYYPKVKYIDHKNKYYYVGFAGTYW